MGLRRRYWRKRLARVYRESAAGIDAGVVDAIRQSLPDAEGNVRLPFQDPYVTPELLARHRDALLQAAELAEADRLEEAAELVRRLEEEMAELEREQQAREEREQQALEERKASSKAEYRRIDAEQEKRRYLEKLRDEHVARGTPIRAADQAEIDRFESASDPILTSRERLFGRSLAGDDDIANPDVARDDRMTERKQAASRPSGTRDTASSGGRIVSILSSSAAAGKTFVATNLAVAIANSSGEDTAVIDLDIDMGSVFDCFGKEPTATIEDLMALGEGVTQDAIRAAGIEVAPGVRAYGSPPDPAAEAPGAEAIRNFIHAVRDTFAWVVVDGLVNYSDSALVCFDLSEVICLVTGLDVVAVKHLSKSLDTLLKTGLPRERFRVVLNRADSNVGLDASDVERFMGIKVGGVIPTSGLVPQSMYERQSPVVLDEPVSEVSLSIRTLAANLLVDSPLRAL